MNRIRRLYPLKGEVEVKGRIGRLYPAYLHPWVVDLGSEGEAEVKDEGGGGRNLGTGE